MAAPFPLIKCGNNTLPVLWHFHFDQICCRNATLVALLAWLNFFEKHINIPAALAQFVRIFQSLEDTGMYFPCHCKYQHVLEWNPSLQARGGAAAPFPVGITWRRKLCGNLLLCNAPFATRRLETGLKVLYLCQDILVVILAFPTDPVIDDFFVKNWFAGPFSSH